jgi:hypothetical protein
LEEGIPGCAEVTEYIDEELRIWQGKGGELVTDEDEQERTRLRQKYDNYFRDPNYLAKWSRDQLFLIFLLQEKSSSSVKLKKMRRDHNKYYDAWAQITYGHIDFMLSSVEGRRGLKELVEYPKRLEEGIPDCIEVWEYIAGKLHKQR